MHYKKKMKIEIIVSKLKSRLNHLIISLTLEKKYKISPLKYNFKLIQSIPRKSISHRFLPIKYKD